MVKTIHTCQTKVFGLTEGQSLKEWLETSSKARSHHKNEERTNRVDVIMDFEFPELSHKVKVTRDGRFIGAIGGFPNSFKVWDIANMTLKFQRGMDFCPVDFIFLGESWQKVAILGDSRQLEIHNSQSCFFKTRLPKQPRCMAYDAATATLLIAGSSNEIWRLNLEEGTWMPPLVCEGLEAINAMVVSPVIPVVFVGGEGVNVEAWSLKQEYDDDGTVITPTSPVATLDAWKEDDDDVNGVAITALDTTSNGLELAIGYASGMVRIFNITSKTDYCLEYDMRNGLPVKSISTLKRSFDPEKDMIARSLVSRDALVIADAKSIKIIRKSSGTRGELVACIDSSSVVNHVDVYPQSGVIFVATDNPRLDIYYAPLLGSAPFFSEHLDSLTGEAETEEHHSFFEDFKFVTRAQLQQIGADHLLGSDFLKPHMHGYFIDFKIYEEYRQKSKPAILATNIATITESKKAKALEAMRPVYKESKKRVNAKLWDSIKDVAKDVNDEEQQIKRQKKIGGLKKLLQEDDRFAAILENEKFER